MTPTGYPLAMHPPRSARRRPGSACQLLLALAAAVTAPAQAPSSDVSVGVFPFLVGDMDNRVHEIVNNCQTHGVDSVYVSVFRTTGPTAGTLWVDDDAGDWNPAWGPVRPGGAGIDLGQLIAQCHAANVRVIGVLKCFDVSVQPDHSGHRQFLLDVVDYFVDAWLPNGTPVYDLDGFALDYVRYVGAGGGPASPQTVTNFIADVRAAVGGLSLHAYLPANRSTFDPAANGSFQSYANVRSALANQYGQDWQQLAPWLDALLPMAYTADGTFYNTYARHQAYVEKTAEYARQACVAAGTPARRVVPAIRTYADANETTTALTIAASVTGALLGTADGYQAFRYDFLTTTPQWWGPVSTYAVPGSNWPRPVLSTSSPQLTATLDPSGTVDSEQPSASLQLRYDFDGDGVFDTGWTPNTTSQTLHRHPGAWHTTMQVRDQHGHTSTTRRRTVTGSPLTLLPNAIATSTGGTVTIVLDLGPMAAFHTYLVLGSLSGTSPGFVWATGFPVPLNIDPVTSFFVTYPNGGLLQDGLGTFDGLGRATAQLHWPAQLLTFLQGYSLHWSFLAQSTAGAPSCVGNSRALQLQ